jgi:ApbE superfamily uncharacterized protein (UPF0280 family)
MRQPPQIGFLPDHKRLHMSDGPIDLIVEAFGDPGQIRAAYRAAAERFVTVLDELCSELPLLRQPMSPRSTLPAGVVGRRMAQAVVPYAQRCFITPMAAVAGSVAEEILNTMTCAAGLSRAYVNNGGDIAFHLTPGEHLVAGMMERPDRPSLFGTATLHHDQPARGIATSGWRGRSFSLGIADAVTVVATTASLADAAATVIANAVDLPYHPRIFREPARNLAPDSDLGDIPVTRDVPQLLASEINSALGAGTKIAEELLATKLIGSAALYLQGHIRIIPTPIPRHSRRSPLHAHYSDSRSLLHA